MLFHQGDQVLVHKRAARQAAGAVDQQRGELPSLGAAQHVGVGGAGLAAARAGAAVVVGENLRHAVPQARRPARGSPPPACARLLRPWCHRARCARR